MSGTLVFEFADGDIFVLDSDAFEADADRLFRALAATRVFSLDEFDQFIHDLAGGNPLRPSEQAYLRSMIFRIVELWMTWILFDAPNDLLSTQLQRMQALVMRVKMLALAPPPESTQPETKEAP